MPGRAHPPRIRDVASLAGVSPKTVSNVVNGTDRVSASTRARVEQVIAELGYRPNIAARNLRRGRTGLLTLALPDLDVPYFAELTRGIVDAAGERGYTVLIDQTNGDPGRESYVVDGVGARMADGVIFSPLAMDAEALSRRIQRTPMVLLGEKVPADGVGIDRLDIDHIGIDNVAAAQSAVSHLIGTGRRRVAVIGAEPSRASATADVRIVGYRRAHSAAHRRIDPALIIPTRHFRRRDGAEAARQLLSLSQPPDAVFCCSDLLALGLLRALHERGVRVPDDIAVVGFDDIEDGSYSIPTLSTVAPDKLGIARAAVHQLLERIGGSTGPGREITVGHELRIRESSRPS
ncbi:MAG TPA: LacI family DNA-binding transcriptional regulator [Mycobacteriales bacterium]|jgi:DNA-binding LacI/PurR family transcriptional regulator|nr:LacI family DNA-binding transcriptional regulator [Mycobacteriales bacterium]